MSKQVIVEVDDALAQDLERVAPSASRRRSAFIREALRRAIDELAEERMARAYRARPDAEPATTDPRVWEPAPYPARARRRRR